MTTIANDQGHEAAVKQLIVWEQAPATAPSTEAIEALADEVERYETTAGHTPAFPLSVRGLLEVEMFKRRIRQRELARLLEISEPRLSEIMKGRREMNLDFAKRLFTKLAVPADVILALE